jgi:hypothetical protein
MGFFFCTTVFLASVGNGCDVGKNLQRGAAMHIHLFRRFLLDFCSDIKQ